MNENILTLNGVIYEAQTAAMSTIRLSGESYPSCQGCSFYEELESCDDAKNKINCVAEYRQDARNIIWIKQQ